MTSPQHTPSGDTRAAGDGPAVLVIVNSPTSGPRRLGDWLAESGLRVVEKLGSEGLPDSIEGYDGLVMLGGGMMPDDDVKGPWLPAERDLAAQAIDADLPTLGICLGGQLLAHVAGGEVRADHGPKERGATLICPNDLGRSDRLLGTLGEGAPMIENHQDMITELPPGSVLLASSAALANQAFRIGRHVRGLQFHPEASAESLSGWDDAAMSTEGYSLAELVAAAREVDAANTAAARDLVAAFAAEVRAEARRSGAANGLDAAVGSDIQGLDGVLRDAAARVSTAAESVLPQRLDPRTLAQAPACVAAVTFRGEVVAVQAHGRPRLDDSETTARTVFRIASMTKSFLAATALSLRDDGLLDLSDPAARFIPGIDRASMPDTRTGFDATLEELLSNRSGLAEDNPWGDDHLPAPRGEIAGVIEEGLTLSAYPGTTYQYSNLGVSLVGRAIEARTHRPVDEVIAERILNPLGLSMTRPKASLYPEGTDLAAGYRTVDSGETFTAQPVLDAGALGCIGELYSDVADLATWMHFLGSAFDDFHDPAHEAVLSAATRRRMQTAHTLMLTTDWPFEGKNLDGAGYGYGVIVEADHRFGRIVQHSGGLPGYSSHMCWHPASGVGVVVMANSDSFGTWRVAGDLLRGVLEAAGAPSAPVTLWPQTLDAARRLDAAVISGRCIGVEHYRLARNVLRDATTEERHARLERALERTGPILPDPGPLESRILTAEGPASLRWRIPCRDGALIADMRMVGLADPLVQAFSVSVAGPDGRKPIGEGSRASDHHRVAWPED